MRIAIDLRSLQSGTVSGVENYTFNLLEELLAMDKINRYVLFYNSVKNARFPEFNFINVQTLRSRWPNKLLNLMFKFKFLSLETLIGDFDVLFMPNLNIINTRSTGGLAITVHDLSFELLPEYYDLKRKLWHKFLDVKKLLGRANVIFAVSSYTKNDLIKIYNLPAEKIKVIYPGVDTRVFNPNIPIHSLRKIRNAYGLPGEFFLFLNTLEPRKNLTGVIEAFEKINSSSHLVIAGKKGWKTSPILRRLKRSKSRHRIHYIGYLQEQDKPALLKMAKALIYPSFYEGFGFQPLEAMAVGTPVVASQITALSEVVGSAGILINPYNTRDIIDAMESLDKNQTLRNSLIQKGLERVRGYNWRITALQTLAYLESLNK